MILSISKQNQLEHDSVDRCNNNSLKTHSCQSKRWKRCIQGAYFANTLSLTFLISSMSPKIRIHSHYFILLVLAIFIVYPCRGSSSNTTKSNSGKQIGESTDKSLDEGMKPLYIMTEGLLGKVIQPKSLNVSSISIKLLLNIRTLKDFEKDWKEITKHYVGFFVCAAIAVVFIIVMPIVAICFCCCRCCGRCGGNIDDFDPKHARCKRNVHFTMVLIFTLIILAGVVCSFVTLSLFYKRVNSVKASEHSPFQQIYVTRAKLSNFLNTGFEHFNDVAKSYRSFSEDLISKANNTAMETIDSIMEEVNVSHVLNQAERLADSVNDSINVLEQLKLTLEELVKLQGELQQKLNTFKRKVLEITAQCGSVCSRLTNQINKLHVNVNFTQLKAHEKVKENIEKVKDLPARILEGRKEFEQLKVRSTSSSAYSEAIKAVRNNLNKVDETVDRSLRKVREIKGNILTFLERDFMTTIKSVDAKAKETSQYWYIALIVLCGIIALIVTLNFIGMLFGVCGHRPKDSSCCTRDVAANLFMAGVGFCLIFIDLFMLVVLVTFLPGGFAFTEVCQFTNNHNPMDLMVYSDVLKISNLLPNDKPLDIIHALESCRKNKGMYTSLALENVFNVSKTIDLTVFNNKIDAVDINVTIEAHLPSTMKDELRKFSESGLANITMDDYKEQIKENVTTVNLDYLLDTINRLKNSVRRLEGSATELAAIKSTTLTDLDKTRIQFSEIIDKLEEKTHIKAEIDKLLNMIDEAERNFNTEGPKKINKVIAEKKNETKLSIVKFVRSTTDMITNSVAKCRPLYDAVYDLSDAVCIDTLRPFNGFWFSIAWCIFFSIPCMIFSVKLAGLYRRVYRYIDGVNYDEGLTTLYHDHDNPPENVPMTRLEKYPNAASGVNNAGYFGGRPDHNLETHHDFRNGLESPPPAYSFY